MEIISKKIHFSTKGHGDVINVTEDVEKGLSETELQRGVMTVFISGATGAITTIEYEPGLVKDFQDLMEELAPGKGGYQHDRSHAIGNAHSHLRASLIGPSLSVPFENGKLKLGTWQQIVFIDFDTRQRKREIIVQIIGEK